MGKSEHHIPTHQRFDLGSSPRKNPGFPDPPGLVVLTYVLIVAVEYDGSKALGQAVQNAAESIMTLSPWCQCIDPVEMFLMVGGAMCRLEVR